jgi:hypothetical protein
MVRTTRDATIFCGFIGAGRRARRGAPAPPVMIQSRRHGGARPRLRRELARLGAPRAAVTVDAVSPMLAAAARR